MTQRIGDVHTIEAWAREEGAPAPLGAIWVEFGAGGGTSRCAREPITVIGTVPRAHELPTGERVGLRIMHADL